ncbi:MAG: large conductance mechanosensitive channel protein MscL [Eubacteriales bacterium]|nr:large conductance mechanosensitive channel protein MscL [Eubacteriales bacterium]
MKKNTFFEDFKKFISRGNVMDMAVGVVIGGAFGKIVTGLVNYIINPIVAVFTGNGTGLSELKTVITPEKLDDAGKVVTAEVAIMWGTWLQTIIDFLIVALCVFVMLRVVMKARNVIDADKIEEEKKKADEAKKKAEEAKKAADEAAKALAERQKMLEESVLNQEKLLMQISESLKNKNE